MTRHDAIVIGRGQAGPFLAVHLAKSGMSVALIEREHCGGTCVNDGCVPSRTPLASARTAHVARRAADERVRGRARFTGSDAVKVNRRTFAAPKIFIDVGGRAVLPDWPGIDSVPAPIDIGTISLHVPPEHLIVAGGSYIGLKFAQMFRRFGAQLTVLEVADRLSLQTNGTGAGASP